MTITVVFLALSNAVYTVAAAVILLSSVGAATGLLDKRAPIRVCLLLFIVWVSINIPLWVYVSMTN